MLEDLLHTVEKNVVRKGLSHFYVSTTMTVNSADKGR